MIGLFAGDGWVCHKKNISCVAAPGFVRALALIVLPLILEMRMLFVELTLELALKMLSKPLVCLCSTTLSIVRPRTQWVRTVPLYT